MTILKANDMHCEMCVKRITEAMKREGMNFTVSLKDKTVAIDGDRAAVTKAREIMDDLGFDTTVEE